MVLHLHRLSARAPLATGAGQLTDLLLFLGVHTDHRLTGGLVVFDLLVEVTELGIAVGMLGAFEGLGIGLQAETLLDEQLAYRRRRDAVTLPGQLFSQVPQRLSRPPQRRHRIPAFVRLD